MMKLVVVLMVAAALTGCGEADGVSAVQPEPVDAATEPAQDAPGEGQAADGQGEAEASLDGGGEAGAEAAESGPEASVEAGCPDAPCQPADLNCDLACGEVDPACAAMCDINADFAFTLPMGVTRVRMPRFDAQMLQCSSCEPDGAWWSFLAKLPEGSCGVMMGPSGLWLSSKYVPKGEHPKSGTCVASNGGGCASFGSATGPEPLDTYLYITTTHPLPGFVVTVDVRAQGDCGGIDCNPGCNGSPQ